MSWTKVAKIHRQLAELHRELAEELARSEEEGGEWVDQYHSPLGRRQHLKLVRDGKLVGRKPDRVRVLVRRAELDAYIEAHPARRPLAPAAPPVDAGERDPVQLAARLRGKLGLVRAR